MMEILRKRAKWLLILSVLMLGVQFFLVFSGSRIEPSHDLLPIVINLIPYGVFLLSLWLLFSKEQRASVSSSAPSDTGLPQHNKIIRSFVVLVASFGAATGAFIVLLVLSIMAFGSASADVFEKYMLPGILGLAVICGPFLYKYLR